MQLAVDCKEPAFEVPYANLLARHQGLNGPAYETKTNPVPGPTKQVRLPLVRRLLRAIGFGSQ